MVAMVAMVGIFNACLPCALAGVHVKLHPKDSYKCLMQLLLLRFIHAIARASAIVHVCMCVCVLVSVFDDM